MRALLALLLSALALSAATYFVDPATGNDANNGTSTGTAWAHLPSSMGVAVGGGWVVPIPSGSTVVVKGGSVNINSWSNTSTYFATANSFDNIVIQSGHLFTPQWGTTRAIIDGQSNLLFGVGFDNTANGLTLDGFEIRNIAPDGGTGNRAWNGNGSACIEQNACSFWTVRNCYLHDSFSGLGVGSNDKGHGIEMGRSGTTYGTQFRIYQNIIGANIQCKGVETVFNSLGVVSNNFFHGDQEHQLSLSTSTNIDVCNNLFDNEPPYNTSPNCSIEMGDCVAADIWNNVMFTTPGVTDPGGHTVMGITFVNNGVNNSNRIVFNSVSYYNGANNAGGSGTAVASQRSSTRTFNYNFYENNLIYSNYNAFLPDHMGVSLSTNTFNTTFTFNNVFGLNTTENTCEWESSVADNKSTAPLFNPPMAGTVVNNNLQVNPGMNLGTLPTGLDSNFHPNTTYFVLSQTNSNTSAWIKTSNVINGDATHGYSHAVGKFGTDIVGYPRSLWSMGAYEFQPFLPIITNVTLILK